MADNRQLWSGPFGAALAERALDTVPVEPTGLWIVPTPLMREHAERVLARRPRRPFRPRVWTWEDLWAAVRRQSDDGPACLPPAGTRTVLMRAIETVRGEGRLREVARVAGTAGFRRRLRGQFAAWTREERDPQGEPPADGGLVTLEEWAIFVRYRGLLNRLKAEDPEGLAVWASRTLTHDPPPELRRFGYATVLDLTTLHRPVLRALGHLLDRAAAVLVTLPFDHDCGEAFAAVAPVRERLREWRFTESLFDTDDARPAGLLGIERGMFRAVAPRLDEAVGLVVRGAPEGEGVALAIARRVRDLLDRSARPDDILILFPRWDEQAISALRTLRAWEIAATAEIDESPAVHPILSTLRLVLSLPARDWEADRLVRILRNSSLRLPWSDGPWSLVGAASAIRATRVFRGRSAIRDALRRASDLAGDPQDEAKARRAREALVVFDGLAGLLDDCERPAPWRLRVEQLHRIVEALGLDFQGPLQVQFLDALDDQGGVLDGLRRGQLFWTWDEFTREIDGLARELTFPGPAAADGAVRLATVAQAEGRRARHVVLAGLAEGTFPAREALAPRAEENPDGDSAELAFAREAFKFLRVVGAAQESLTLIYPNTDEKGQTLLAAGFLDEVRGRFSDDAWASCHQEVRRLDPVLDAALALAPSDARVRAVALACGRRGTEELRSLAGTDSHRAAWEATAAALRVAHARDRRPRLGRHEGRLADPRAIRRIAEDFGPDRPALSPSQLESLAFCPFQFYARYVLRLEPTDEREELDDDHAGHGSLIHRALEELHTSLRDDPPDGMLSEHVPGRVELVVRRLLEERRATSVVDAGLRRIEGERLLRTGRRYADQFAAYAAREQSAVECHQFEVAFGSAQGSAHPDLVLGDEDQAVRLQGKIDRIDLIRRGEDVLFRVIDYKSGSTPRATDLKAGLALQLPLYALAVERVILADAGAIPLDIGYWSLRGQGYRNVQAMAQVDDDGISVRDDWLAYRRGLEAYVLALVARLRRADFPVHPRVADCTRLCDFRSVCRIAQVRARRKADQDVPSLEIDA